MKVELWLVGKTSQKYLQEGMNIFEKRLKHYLPFEIKVFSDIKNPPRNASLLKQKEGAMILENLRPGDFLILLDERGKHHSSMEFAKFIEQKLLLSSKRLIFAVGGAFGFSNDVYERANSKLSLSAMTFSHQMVRLFFLEQLYRAMTIIRNEPYHNS